MIPTEKFLEKYPTCPLCFGELEKKEFSLTSRTFKSLYVDESETKKTFHYMRCKYNGHYQVNFKAWEDRFVNSITMMTEYYQIRISLDDNKIGIIYNDSDEKTIEFKDYTKWMLQHEELLEKIKLLWVIS